MLMRFRVDGTCSSPISLRAGSVRRGTIKATLSGSTLGLTERIR